MRGSSRSGGSNGKLAEDAIPFDLIIRRAAPSVSRATSDGTPISTIIGNYSRPEPSQFEVRQEYRKRRTFFG